MFYRIQLVILAVCYKTLQTLRKYGKVQLSNLAVFGDDDLGLRIVCFGEFETETLSYLRDFFKTSMRDKQFIDVGANLGNHSNGLFKSFAECHAFEPSPRTFHLLKANMADKPNVICRQIALSDYNGAARFHQDNSNSGKSYIVDKPPFSAKKNDDSYIEIKTIRLDDALTEHSKIGLIKIDVEGHELQVLQGAVNILQDHKPLVMIEVLASEISNGQTPSLNFLQEKGYTTFFNIEPKALQISLISNTPILRWMNHLILILDLIILGPRGVSVEELDIASLKKKNYSTILVSA